MLSATGCCVAVACGVVAMVTSVRCRSFVGIYGAADVAAEESHRTQSGALGPGQ